MKKGLTILMTVLFCISPVVLFAAYHHEGESDTANFLTVYLDKAGTKLDHCGLCHTGGEYIQSGKTVKLGSCQWCHYSYGYDGHGNIADTLNPYGMDYFTNGQDADSVEEIKNLDSDQDGYTNNVEITANNFPGDPNDDPSLVVAPSRVYTRDQIEAMIQQHTEFLLMNASRSTDNYTEYSGVPLRDLLTDAGIQNSSTGIIAFAPDGWSQYHPLEYDEDPELYHVFGNFPSQNYQYPPSVYYYDAVAQSWCDYSSINCAGRDNNDPIFVNGGLKAILATKRDGSHLTPGVLTSQNKLDGEGPFRIVVPQKNPGPPDQSSKSSNPNLIWPYDSTWDHNAGACTRTVTIIKVEPLPEGTTDVNAYEDGWNYVDQNKIIIYGNIKGGDSNGNGVLDTEERTNENLDFDSDGIPDYKDRDSARFNPSKGSGKLFIHTDTGTLADCKAINDSDPSLPQNSKPNYNFPYGAASFKVTGLDTGEVVVITIVFPNNVPQDARFFKINDNGWNELPIGSNDGDNTITITLQDGDNLTDSDGEANGTIDDPGALALEIQEDGGGGGGCFINSVERE